MRRTAAAAALLGILTIGDAQSQDTPSKTAQGAPAGEALFSKTHKNLKGRLVVRRTRVPQDEVIDLVVELHNVDSLPIAVVTHSPFAFDLQIRDARGQDVKPTTEGGEILSSPETALVTRNCYLGLPATQEAEPEKRYNLGITTKGWKLVPGRYVLSGTYTLGDDDERVGPEPGPYPGNVQFWTGTLDLPPVEIEIAP